MINFLHTFHPQHVLVSIGPIHIHWYGLFIVLGALAAILITVKLAAYQSIKKEIVIDLSFWLLISGIIGARLYHVLLELPYYIQYPLNIFKLWNGGLAIHGAIVAGLIVVWFFAKRNNYNFWQLSAMIAPGLVLAQAIGRWGNYFRQELFGKPTDLPWGIPINLTVRPLEYLNYEFFHPAFLYESLGNLIIFFVLIAGYIWLIKKGLIGSLYYQRLLAAGYLALYSILRFGLEFIRIDATPIILGLRLPQWVSLIIILACSVLLFAKYGPKGAGLEK